jgi:transcriptional regulator with XRE-family HTH domain
MKYQKTEWGLKVLDFAQRNGLTLKEVAARSGVNYNTFLQFRIGKTTGEAARVAEKVDAFMAEYAAEGRGSEAIRPWQGFGREATP